MSFCGTPRIPIGLRQSGPHSLHPMAAVPFLSEAFARAEVTAFLQKPFDISALLKTLREALEAGPPARDPAAPRGG